MLSLQLLDKLPKASQIVQQKQGYCLAFSKEGLASKYYELLQTAQNITNTNPFSIPKQLIKNRRKIKGNVEQLAKALGKLALTSDENSIYLELDHPSLGAIPMKALLEYYLGLPPQLWNTLVKITRIF